MVETELPTALDEIGLITRLRLVDKVDGPGAPRTNGRLSTHVLDTFHGRAAAGMAFTLYEVGASARGLLHESVTNADGRTDAPLIGGEPLRIGTYELQFAVGAYFKPRGRGARRPAVSRRGADPLRHRRTGRSLSCAAGDDALELLDLSRKLTRKDR